MPRPDQLPDWATSANYDATDPSDPHHGTPTKVEPSSAAKANGFEPGWRPPAQFFNWLFSKTKQWVEWLDEEVTYLRESIDSPATRWLSIHASEFSPNDVSTNGVWYYDADAGCLKASTATQRWCVLPLERFIPTGGEIVEVRALVKPGAPEAMRARIAQHTRNYNARTQARSLRVGYVGSGAAVELASMSVSGTTNRSTIGTDTLASPLVVMRSITSRISTGHTHTVLEIQNTGSGIDELYGVQIGVNFPPSRSW